jgi:3-deoxy-D-arabino-heptulosonate 7-phosphate (DAHP) synthase
MNVQEVITSNVQEVMCGERGSTVIVGVMLESNMVAAQKLV